MGRAEDFDDSEEEMVSIHLRMPVSMRQWIDNAAAKHHRTRTAEILTALDIYLMIVSEIDECIVDEAVKQASTPEVVDRVEKEDDEDW